MKYVLLLILLLLAILDPSAMQAQSPPQQLGLFETWIPVSADSIGTGVRYTYVGATAPGDSAEVAYGQSGGAAAWRAIVGGEVWAKTLTGGPAFPVSVELGEIEYYLATHPLERERLEALLFDRDQLGFIRFFGAQTPDAPVPVVRSP